MTTEELSRAVALACGWEETDNARARTNRWYEPNQTYRFLRALPDFATSLDACVAPGGPVEYAKAKGWYIDMAFHPQRKTWFVDFGKDYVGYLGDTGESPRLSSALCLAFLTAVKANPGVENFPEESNG